MPVTAHNRTVRKAALKFLTVREVASQLSVSERTVHRWAAQRELAVYRFGRSVRISEVDLQTFLAVRRDED
jgi:excisionase family DNA binding protein